MKMKIDETCAGMGIRIHQNRMSSSIDGPTKSQRCPRCVIPAKAGQAVMHGAHPVILGVSGPRIKSGMTAKKLSTGSSTLNSRAE